LLFQEIDVLNQQSVLPIQFGGTSLEVFGPENHDLFWSVLLMLKPLIEP
jgi:hypothetical protein